MCYQFSTDDFEVISLQPVRPDSKYFTKINLAVLVRPELNSAGLSVAGSTALRLCVNLFILEISSDVFVCLFLFLLSQ